MVPVVVLTNLSPDDRIMEKVIHYEPSYYVVKSRTSIDDVISKVTSAIKSRSESV